jgi:hypothetical protein
MTDQKEDIIDAFLSNWKYGKTRRVNRLSVQKIVSHIEEQRVRRKGAEAAKINKSRLRKQLDDAVRTGWFEKEAQSFILSAAAYESLDVKLLPTGALEFSLKSAKTWKTPRK